MARRPRIEYRGALYHVIARGNQRQRIFVDDSDRRHYLDLLLALKKTCFFRLYAYVLMHNHVHMLLETGTIPLSRIMQRLTGGYTQYFNRKHGLSGHLFQGRYKAILCAKDSYLLELSRYIHLNPVRVKTVRDPAKYRWSSYSTYLGNNKAQDEFVDVEPVLAYFGLNDGRSEYRKFVLQGIEEGHRAEYYEAAEGRILGDEKFVEEIKTKSGEKEKPRLTIKPQEFVEQVCKALGKKPQEVIGAAKNRERVRIRQILSYIGRNYTDLQVKTLAATLKVDPTCVSRCVAIVERQLEQDKMLRAEVRRVQNIIYHA
jgi:REP-associated tyrosine transposase